MEKLNLDVNGKSYFSAIGLSHRTAPLSIREKFNLSPDRVKSVIEKSRENNIQSILPVSTCNRVELYASDTDPEMLSEVLCEVTGNDLSVFHKYGYVKSNNNVIEHLFRVCGGLDSKVFGDSQITGQVGDSLQYSVIQDAIEAPLSRLAESAINAGKKIRSAIQNKLSSPSVAETAVDMIMAIQNRKIGDGISNNSFLSPDSNLSSNNISSPKVRQDDANYLIVGLGKMGKLILSSLLKYVSKKNITIINRTDKISEGLNSATGIRASDLGSIKQEIEKADIIFVATSAGEPVIKPEYISTSNYKSKIFVDLGIPRNVDISISESNEIRILDLDDIQSRGSSSRHEIIDLAEEIINAGKSEYLEWLHRYTLAQEIKAELFDSFFLNSLDENIYFVHSKFIEGLTGKHLRHMQKTR